MVQHVISSQDLRAEVSTDGAKIVDLHGRVGEQWVPLGQLFCAGPVANRARDGRMVVDGKTFDLAHPVHPTDALHGVWPWIEHDLVERSETTAKFRFERAVHARSFPYPSEYSGTTRYCLRDNVLRVSLEVENLDDRPLPVGLVSHPLFLKQVMNDRRPEIFFFAEAYYPSKDNLPTGKRSRIPPEMDYSRDAPMREMTDGANSCFYGWNGVARVRYPKTGYEWVIVDCMRNCKHLQFWSPPDLDIFALEPQSTVGDACNLRDVSDLGLVVLRKRGEIFAVSHSYAWMPMA